MLFPTLGIFIPQMQTKLGGRTDIDSDITLWLKDAYRDLTMSYPFETLEKTVDPPTFTTPGVDTYPYPSDARGMKALTIINGTTPFSLKKKNIEIVRRYETGRRGTPAVWTPYGANFIIRASPDKAYQLIEDYWKKPNIDETSNETIQATHIELPDDWFEVLVYDAVERAHQSLQEFDKAQAVHTQLHGDPNPSKGFPGMIREKQTRDSSENVLSDYGMRPRVRRFGSVR